MEAFRLAEFKAKAVHRLHSGAAAGLSPESVAANIAGEQRALARAILTPGFAEQAATSLRASQLQIITDPRYHLSEENALEAMRQIMQRRAAEAEHYAALIMKPELLKQLVATTPAAADASVPSLHKVKMQETLGELLHLENGAPQVIAHIEAAAKGTMLMHQALATLFAPDGALRAPLAASLAKQLPRASAESISTLAGDWLNARASAASITVDLCANEGEAYREAVRQSTQWHRKASSGSPAPTIQEVIAQQQKSARNHEQEKDRHQRAEDIAYTLNHALSCGTTDIVLQPAIAAAIGVNVGCAHDHDDHAHAAHHDHAHAKPKFTFKSFMKEAGHYMKGEIFGDFVAVPLTIGVQRLFPGFMNGLRNVSEPMFGWAFRAGADHSAKVWAKQQGKPADAPEVAARAHAIYEHEVSHLPQAIVWNVFAFPIGMVGQKMGGHSRSYGEIFKSKLAGAGISNGLLIGGRMLSPGAAQKWDQTMSDTVLIPTTKVVGKLFGIDEKTMEKAAKRQHESHGASWTARVENAPQMMGINVSI